MRRVSRLVAVAILCALPSFLTAQAPTAWKATELWRVDGSEGGEAFGSVRDMVIGKDNALWILDYKDQHIRRFDANGKPLTTVGRKGSGPGELQDANGMLATRDGSVWVNDPRQKRFSVFHASGAFDKQFVVIMGGYGYRWDAWLDRATGDVMDMAIVRRAGAERYTNEWRRITTAGAIKDTMAMPSCSSAGSSQFTGFKAESKTGNMFGTYKFSNGGGRVADGYGAMWCAVAASSRAALVRIGKNDTLAQSSIALSGIPVDKLERDSAITEARAQVAKYTTNDFDPAKLPTSKPPIAGLYVDEDSRLWILHSSRMNDRHVTLDVHDRAGKHLGRLRVPARLSAEGIPLRARGNDLWVAVRDDDDVVQIVKYRVGR